MSVLGLLLSALRWLRFLGALRYGSNATRVRVVLLAVCFLLLGSSVIAGERYVVGTITVVLWGLLGYGVYRLGRRTFRRTSAGRNG